MSGTTTAGTFRHLGGEYALVSPRHPLASTAGLTADKPWAVVEIATGKVWRYKTPQAAFQKRKALIAGVSVKVARGLPA